MCWFVFAVFPHESSSVYRLAVCAQLFWPRNDTLSPVWVRSGTGSGRNRSDNMILQVFYDVCSYCVLFVLSNVSNAAIFSDVPATLAILSIWFHLSSGVPQLATFLW